jgi:hypothetical protein
VGWAAASSSINCLRVCTGPTCIDTRLYALQSKGQTLKAPGQVTQRSTCSGKHLHPRSRGK